MSRQKRTYRVGDEQLTAAEVVRRFPGIPRSTLLNRIRRGDTHPSILGMQANLGALRTPWRIFDPGQFSRAGAERTRRSVEERVLAQQAIDAGLTPKILEAAIARPKALPIVAVRHGFTPIQLRLLARQWGIGDEP